MSHEPRVKSQEGWDFVELPGQHDDLWSNPKPYVDLVKITLIYKII